MIGGSTRRRVDVLGVHVSAITMATAVARIAEWIETNRQHYVCITGVHGVMESQADERLREIHNAAGMVTPDGMPMVWSAHRAGARDVERVYGPDLMLETSREAAERGWRFFLYGGKEGVAERLASRLERWYPGLKVVGWYSPPFRPLSAEEDQAIIDQINALDPHIIWVGLSTPKQERWMAAHVGRVRAPVLIGVGAAFDMHTGAVRQAPTWMQRLGLEWLFRLTQEPRRLWRRYLRNNPRFAMRIAARPPRLIDEVVDPGG
jgi:N-acetylglucosaminyldiphosphoundecaprenol N-acetyl-beta-D-mannosaminyltransferase